MTRIGFARSLSQQQRFPEEDLRQHCHLERGPNRFQSWPLPSVGPKRSVLIVAELYPISTSSLEMPSTNGVDPQTKIFGLCSGGKHASASSALSILRR